VQCRPSTSPGPAHDENLSTLLVGCGRRLAPPRVALLGAGLRPRRNRRPKVSPAGLVRAPLAAAGGLPRCLRPVTGTSGAARRRSCRSRTTTSASACTGDRGWTSATAIWPTWAPMGAHGLNLPWRALKLDAPLNCSVKVPEPVNRHHRLGQPVAEGQRRAGSRRGHQLPRAPEVAVVSGR
jgi:hypothetical protein